MALAYVDMSTVIEAQVKKHKCVDIRSNNKSALFFESKKDFE